MMESIVEIELRWSDRIVLCEKLTLQLHFVIFKSGPQQKNPGRNIYEKMGGGWLGQRARMEEIDDADRKAPRALVSRPGSAVRWPDGNAMRTRDKNW